MASRVLGQASQAASLVKRRAVGGPARSGGCKTLAVAFAGKYGDISRLLLPPQVGKGVGAVPEGERSIDNGLWAARAEVFAATKTDELAMVGPWKSPPVDDQWPSRDLDRQLRRRSATTSLPKSSPHLSEE
ncbi:hypothetical protein CRG98_007742 [Punica granatum]|uniref:Uncharacterized protein n=1 Tax=Punica granatum TaxID=22663 RepID=A0A2I0KU78_PUNGR|nr:hypothetical protein CRG98_007742 [Punica granatum]